MSDLVVVAMSGGVDSSVAAALLLQQGYEVVGATMNLWPRKSAGVDDTRHGICCSLESVEDARRVADTLGIPHYVLNFRDIFEREVVRNFASEYARGRTPNPCIRCNRFVKFEAFLNKAVSWGAAFVATGHYARIDRPSNGRFRLRRALHGEKDQSYALYSLSQDQLSRTLFPLGGIPKSETRRIASDLGLATSDKPESQDLCFVPDGDNVAFLSTQLNGVARPGPIKDLRGRVVGTHQGVAYYTVGQRKGLGIAAPEPLYVVEILSEENTVVVGGPRDLFSSALIAEDVNWVSITPPEKPIRVNAKIRYRSAEVPAVATRQPDGSLLVEFDQPQRAVSPGQAIVLYDGDAVLGGGTILRSVDRVMSNE